MKKNIVLCCETMDAVRIDGVIYETDDNRFTWLHAFRSGKRQQTHLIHFCPWCGKKLPFPYEEATNDRARRSRDEG